LQKAAGKENDGTFKILLNHGADVHSTDMLQQTALQEASRQEHATMVKMLVDYGADPNARAVNPPSLYSRSALQQAAGRGVRRWSVRCSGQVLIQTRNMDIMEVYLP
jgi:ankyrin repeat protein